MAFDVMRIDSHQHFWQYNPEEHVWMGDQMGAIKRDFLPDQLSPILTAVNFDGSVAANPCRYCEYTPG